MYTSSNLCLSTQSINFFGTEMIQMNDISIKSLRVLTLTGRLKHLKSWPELNLLKVLNDPKST